MVDTISVIVPVYNAAKYLDECIQSIIKQTYPDLEILIIDDGSTDNSREICERYKNDTRLRVISKENGGVSDARNLGLSIASGKYITFVDADDVLEIDTYRLVMEAFKKHDPDMVIFRYSNDFEAIHLRNDAPEHIHDEITISEMYDNFMSGAYMGGSVG